jgi:hypothetical protein
VDKCFFVGFYEMGRAARKKECRGGKGKEKKESKIRWRVGERRRRGGLKMWMALA